MSKPHARVTQGPREQASHVFFTHTHTLSLSHMVCCVHNGAAPFAAREAYGSSLAVDAYTLLMGALIYIT